MTTRVTEEVDPANDGHDVATSIQTWEEACEQSQLWANTARRRAYYRRIRRRALAVILLILFVSSAVILYIWTTA